MATYRQTLIWSDIAHTVADPEWKAKVALVFIAFIHLENEPTLIESSDHDPSRQVAF